MKVAELEVQRATVSSHRTLGTLFLNGEMQCYTLEDVDRGLRSDMDLSTILALKKYGRTAIPRGSYKMALTFSNRFKKVLPEVFDVKGFSGVRIHTGNTDLDTDGCILVGNYYLGDDIMESRDAFNNLMAKLKKFDTFTIKISYA